MQKKSSTPFHRFAFTVCICIGMGMALAGISTQSSAELSPAQLTQYQAARESIGAARASFMHALNASPDYARRDSIYSRMGEFLCSRMVDSLVPFWYGTPWNFYGTSEVPGSGTIACGYFVSTILKHAGFRVERIRLAQQSAEYIVRSLSSEKNIRRFSNTPLGEFCESVKKMGQGLYVVGLDCHVGFLAVINNDIFFIHSSYVQPACAQIEAAVQSEVLGWSKYRIAGKITGDKALLKKWVFSQPVPTLFITVTR